MNKSKIAIITGASSGIGSAIAKAFAKEGINIVIADINESGAKKVIREIENYDIKYLFVTCDVGDVKSIENMFETVKKQFGAIDILVNNAGVSRNVPIEEMDEEEWDSMLRVNLKGAFFCSKMAYMEMKKRKAGAIINMASIAGERGGLYAGVNYSASKGGVLALTKAFALQLAKYNITVNAIAPGTVDTEITRRLGHTTSDIPLGRKATTDDIANAALFLVSDMASYITGMTLDINGGQLMR